MDCGTQIKLVVCWCFVVCCASCTNSSNNCWSNTSCCTCIMGMWCNLGSTANKNCYQNKESQRQGGCQVGWCLIFSCVSCVLLYQIIFALNSLHPSVAPLFCCASLIPMRRSRESNHQAMKTKANIVNASRPLD